MPLSPALASLLNEALLREHLGPPRLPHWTFGPLSVGGQQLFSSPGKGWTVAEDRLPLIAGNAAAWMVWQLGGGSRGVAALTVYGDRIDREVGLEAALRAAVTISDKLSRSGTDARPLDARAGRQPLGADNLSSLHRRQVHWERLRLLQERGRLADLDLDRLESASLDDLVALGSKAGRPAPAEPPEEGCASRLAWAAGAWFLELWEHVEDPSFGWWLDDWFRRIFGGSREAKRPTHGGTAEANWRREATLQLRLRTALCLGLDDWLERQLLAMDELFLGDEPLVGPDRAPASLRARVAQLLEDQVVPVALALLQDRSFSVPDLDQDARRALTRALGRRSDGTLYRIDSQLSKIPGQDNEAREQTLHSLARALGKAAAANLSNSPTRGGDMDDSGSACGHGAERRRLSASPLRSGEDLRALSLLVESCPHCREWWRTRSEAEVLGGALAERAASRRAQTSGGDRGALLLIPAAAAMAGALIFAWKPADPVLTTLAGEVSVAGVVTIQAADGSALQHPVLEQDAELRLVAPADSWVSFSSAAVRLPDAAMPDATLLAWAAGKGRLDLVLREHLTRGADGVAARTAEQAPLSVAVGEGVALVVVVLEGDVQTIPDSVSAWRPTAGLPERAVVHQIHVDPTP